MNILALSTWFPYPPDNGSKLRAYALLRILAQSHSVTTIAFSQAATADEIEFTLVGPDGLKIWPVADDPFRFAHVPSVVKYVSPIPVSHWPSRLMRQKVTQLMHEGRWDAVVAFQVPVAGYALQIPKVPAVLDIDASLSYQMHERFVSQTGAVRRVQSWISWKKADNHTSWVLRRFQACTVASGKERPFIERMVQNRPCHVAVVPNGVDCQANRPGPAVAESATLIFNGALTYSANYDAMQYFLSDIYPLIKSAVPDVKLTITGSVRDVDLTGLSLDSSVCLSGYVDDIRTSVARSSVCVVPLRQGGGTRLKILEAMALGVPVVATSKGAEGLEVIDHEHILLADSPAAFAARVTEVLSDSKMRLRLTTNARRLVETRYDWAQIGAAFTRLIEEAVESKHHQPSTV